MSDIGTVHPVYKRSHSAHFIITLSGKHYHTHLILEERKKYLLIEFFSNVYLTAIIHAGVSFSMIALLLEHIDRCS